ncbi:MAG: hypothetical protein LPK28_01610 [Bacteroidota bacterium]|nr:hypothetical protein [Bacteroidota bacterium]
MRPTLSLIAVIYFFFSSFLSLGQMVDASDPIEVAPGYYLDFGLVDNGTWLLKRKYLFFLDDSDKLVSTHLVDKKWESIAVVDPDRTFLLSPDSAREFSLGASVVPGTGDLVMQSSISRKAFFRDIAPKVAVSATSTIYRAPVLMILRVPSTVPTPPLIYPIWNNHGVEYALEVEDEGFFSLGRFVDTVKANRPTLADPHSRIEWNRRDGIPLNDPDWDENRFAWERTRSATERMVTPLNVPAFMNDGSFYIFDHLNDQILIYDPILHKESYFKYAFSDRITDPFVLKDITLGDFYQVTEKNGAYSLIPLLNEDDSYSSIQIGLFPYRIGIRNGYAYLINDSKRFVKRALPTANKHDRWE